MTYQQPVQNPLGQPGQAPVALAKKHGALLGWGIASLVGGVVVGGIGFVLLIFVVFIFVVGGGGNVDAFNEEFSGVNTAGWIGTGIGLVLVVLGIVLLVVRALKRKRERQQR